VPTATLTSKGQTTIPKAVRDYLGLQLGDRIDFILLDGKVLLQPATVDVRSLKGILYRPGRKTVTVEAMSSAVSERFAKGSR